MAASTPAAPASEPTDTTSPPKRDGLHGLGLAPERVFADHGRTSTSRERSGLHQAIARPAGPETRSS